MKVHKNFHYKLFPSTTINFYSFFVALPCSRCSSPFFVPLFSVLPISPFSVHPILFHFSVIPISLFSVLPHFVSLLRSPHFYSSHALLEGDFIRLSIFICCAFIPMWFHSTVVFIPTLFVRVEECQFGCDFIRLLFWHARVVLPFSDFSIPPISPQPHFYSSWALLKCDIIQLSRRSSVRLA